MRTRPRLRSIVSGVCDARRLASVRVSSDQRDWTIGTIGHRAVKPRIADTRRAGTGILYLDRQGHRHVDNSTGDHHHHGLLGRGRWARSSDRVPPPLREETDTPYREEDRHSPCKVERSHRELRMASRGIDRRMGPKSFG
jgi:hypothetical protein